MVYAPVIIPTLNRYEHFVRLISSLQENSYAKYTELYIGLDYPPSEKYRDGYEKIKEFIECGIEGFKNVIVIKHEKNMGTGGNINYLHELVRKQYDRFISSEDDNIVSPNFLEYMNKGLELIKDDDDMCFVCGYSYPVKWYTKELNIIKEQSFVSAWGFGTFYKKRDLIFNTLRNIYPQYKYVGKIRKLREKSLKNYMFMMGMAYRNQYALSDIGYSCYQLLEDKYCLMPTVSLVRNTGWDGSGIHCNESNVYDFSNQSISNDLFFNIPEFIKSSKDIIFDSYNEILINDFFSISYKEYIKAYVKEMIVRLRAKKARMTNE